jgi:hypothetical protein
LSHPIHTEIKQSLAARDQIFEVIKLPARLHDFEKEPGVKVSPFNNYMSKMKNPPHNPALEVFKQSSVWDGMFEHISYNDFRPLTIKEIIHGVPGTVVGPIPKGSTGPGLADQGITMDMVIDKENNTIHRVVLEKMEREEESIEREEEPITLAQVFPKDETLPKEKVEEGNTRYIYMLELSTKLRMRKWCGLLFASLSRGRDSAIGLNPHGLDWKLFYEYLTGVGRKCFALDVKKWDIKYYYVILEYFFAELQKRFPEMPKGWFKQFRAAVRANFFCYVVYKRRVYRVRGQMLSGGLGTAVLNTLLNSVINRSLFKIKVTVPFSFDYDDEVRSKFMGDDSVNAISEDVCEHWNGELFEKYVLEVFNLVTTEFDKQSKILKWRDILEIEFIKRSFRLQNEDVFPPLNKESMLNMVTWFRDTKTHQGNIQQQAMNLHTYAKEAFYHGENFFDSELKKVNKALMDLGQRPFPDNYNSLLEIFHYSTRGVLYYY